MITDSASTSQTTPNNTHYRYELRPGGAQLPVTAANVHEYLSLVARHLLVDSVAPAVEVR